MISNKKQPVQDKRYSVALIGCGDIGFGYDKKATSSAARSHFSAFSDSPFFSIESIVEPNKKRRERIAQKYPLRAYATYAAWAKVERPEVVVIASPDQTHDELLVALVALTPKFVFCEKPLATDPSRIPALLNLYKKHHIGLSVNYSRRSIPEYYTIKKQLEQKKLGKIQLVTIFYSRGFIHNGSHYIDLCTWFFGTPSRIIKESERDGLGSDDTYSCTLRYRNGLEVRLLGIDTSPLTLNEIDMVGTNGRIRIDTFGKITTYAIRPDASYPHYTFFAPTQEKQISDTALTHAVQNIAEHLRKGTPLLFSAKDEVKNASLLLAIQNAPCHN